MVCQALQTYGGYLRDTGGVALSAYFEGENLADPARHPPGGSPGNTGSSTGPFGAVRLSDGQELSAIPWEKLRVLASWNSFTPVTSTPSAHTSGVVLATPASLVSLEVAEHNEQEQARWDGGWTNVLVDPRSVWEIWRRR